MARAVVGVVIVAPPLGVSPWRSGTFSGVVASSCFAASSARRVRGPGNSVDVGAAAPEIFLGERHPFPLGRFVSVARVVCGLGAGVWR